MNPGAGPECKNFAMVLTVHELRILFVTSRCKIMALSRLTCLLRSVYLPGPETKTSGPRMDVEAMVGGSFPSC